MIDTDKYEGHQLSEFKISVAGVHHSWVKRQQTHGAIDTMFVKHATAALIADAPLILEAYKRLREMLYIAENNIPRRIYWDCYVNALIEAGLVDMPFEEGEEE